MGEEGEGGSLHQCGPPLLPTTPPRAHPHPPAPPAGRQRGWGCCPRSRPCQPRTRRGCPARRPWSAPGGVCVAGWGGKRGWVTATRTPPLRPPPHTHPLSPPPPTPSPSSLLPHLGDEDASHRQHGPAAVHQLGVAVPLQRVLVGAKVQGVEPWGGRGGGREGGGGCVASSGRALRGALPRPPHPLSDPLHPWPPHSPPRAPKSPAMEPSR